MADVESTLGAAVRCSMHRVRRVLPSLSTMLDDIGGDLAPVADYLGVTVPTLRAWARSDRCPRAAQVALYFCTTWGRSDLHTDIYNDLQLAMTTVRVLRGEVRRLTSSLAILEKVGDFGAANDPVLVEGGFPDRPVYPGSALERVKPVKALLAGPV